MTTQAEEVGRRLRQLLLLQETVKKVNSLLDLEQLLDEIVGSVADAFGLVRTAVVLKEEHSNDLLTAAVRGFSDMQLRGSRLKIGAGMIGQVAATGKMRYAPDVSKDPYYYSAEPSTLSEIDIPLNCRGRLVGVFSAQSSSLNGFSPEQIELLCALADNIAIAIENARLFRLERTAKENALREQEEARRIQRALLPQNDPEIPGYRVEGVCLQLAAVGGDWYDYLPLDDRNWGIALGDVSGKGLAAALLMAAARSLLRGEASRTSDSPGQILTRLNEALREDLPAERFVTLVYAILDVHRNVMTFANGGHLHPVLVTTGNEPRRLQTEQGLPLGLMESAFTDTVVELHPGDRVVLCSDGILEAVCMGGQEYGAHHLDAFLRSPFISAKGLIADVQRFAEGCPLLDDATAVVVERDGSASTTIMLV